MAKPKKNKVSNLPFILLAAGIAMVITGISLGEHTRVLEQAISICLSCIGIG